VEEVVSNYWMRGKQKILEPERERIRPHSVENSIWKTLWTCRKTDHSMKKCRWRTCI